MQNKPDESEMETAYLPTTYDSYLPSLSERPRYDYSWSSVTHELLNETRIYLSIESYDFN